MPTTPFDGRSARAIATMCAVPMVLTATACGTNGADDQRAEENTAENASERVDVDVEETHPNGASLRVATLGFEGDEILVDVELANSSDEDVKLHHGHDWETDGIRLVDDAGEEYPLPEDKATEEIEVAAGDETSDTLTFRGPLRDDPEQLHLVTNMHEDTVDQFDAQEYWEENGDPKFPAFLVPMDLG